MWLKLSIFCVILVIGSIQLCDSAKILGIFPMSARSHYFLGNSYMRALAEAGHDVTMVSPFEEKNPPKNGTYRDLVLTGLLEKQGEKFKGVNFFEKSEGNPFISYLFILNLFSEVTKEVLEHPVVQNLIKSEEKYDVVVVSQFLTEPLKAFAHHFGAHLIVFNNHGPNSWINHLVGNPSPLSYVPEALLSFSPEMTICQRIENVLFSWFNHLILQLYIYPSQSKILQKYFPNAPPLEDVIYNTSLVLINGHESLLPPVPHVPNMITIGGFHVKKPKPLPKDLKEYLDNAKEGVVYFSMGSNLQSKQFPEAKRDAILKTFAKLKQKVLWKWEDDSLPGKPDNVKISKWLPQSDLLAHPNIKVFITHGGFLSTTETVYNGVPTIAIPIAGDQKMNAKSAEQAGYCIIVPYNELSEEKLTAALTEILTNPKYMEVAKMRSKIMRDRPMNPVDTAVWWTEYIIRHNGAKHLRVAGIRLPWYSYYSVDVYAILIFVIVTALYIALKVCCCCLSLLRNKKTKPKLKKQ